jgi:hypothetical protein
MSLFRLLFVNCDTNAKDVIIVIIHCVFLSLSRSLVPSSTLAPSFVCPKLKHSILFICMNKNNKEIFVFIIKIVVVVMGSLSYDRHHRRAVLPILTFL